ncbi:Trigger factor [Cardinium endosymbiont cEper1 of Encarsia pergandiella]|uniref:trigger factor n=1 Tax=Cardinium endosymbiont of Encarsia pergandiella TaxID=249402 RepID=UPI00027EA8F6|nr:trigger factor Tig [Cardinium endosymbiont of Encarsia pergandiella]CCM10428.1 Trigger factor [Cardinium endosymbiont cEper1 of Encarsia pergandiella]
MDIQFNKINPNHGVISITLHEFDYKSAVAKQFKHYAQTVRLKGFRLGSVPEDLIKKMYGSSILAEELHKIAVASLKNYILQEHISIFMDPILVTPLQEIHLKNQDTFTFSYEVGLIEKRPIVFEPNISITEFEIDHVESKLVDEFLEGLQMVHGQVAHLEESAMDTMLYGTLVDSTGAIGIDIRISIMHIPEHLREELVGRRVGQKVMLTEESLKHHFPALLGVSFSDFIAFKKYESAWPATFTIDKIVQVVPMAIEPALFDLVLGKGVAHSENEFREAIAKIILFDKRAEARHAFYQDLQEALLKDNKVDLPEAFLKRWLMVNNPEATLEAIEEYYDAHKEDLRWELLLSNIVRQNNLAVTTSDVVDETKRAYVDYAAHKGLQLEENDAAIHTGAISFLQGSEGSKYYSKLHNQLSRDRAINFIKKQITIVTETVSAGTFDAKK